MESNHLNNKLKCSKNTNKIKGSCNKVIFEVNACRDEKKVPPRRENEIALSVFFES